MHMLSVMVLTAINLIIMMLELTVNVRQSVGYIHIGKFLEVCVGMYRRYRWNLWEQFPRT